MMAALTAEHADLKYRAMFPFKMFNPMQSKSLDDVRILC